MLGGISAICKQYESNGFIGVLRFSISEKEGIQNIDLCEDTTGIPGANIVPMDRLPLICERLTFGWISVYLTKAGITGFDYKINIQGMQYKKLEKECERKCRSVKVVVRKSNT